MKLIVGLGNAGEKYRNTRHNVGFMLLDTLSSKFGVHFESNSKFSADITRISASDVFLMKPLTFMNNSGVAVEAFVHFYKIDPLDIVVVHDDVDLPFGTFKYSKGSSSAGHHGVEDIMEKLATKEFYRIRVGIGRPLDATPVDQYVLKDFTSNEIVDLTNKINLAEILSLQ